MTEAEARAAIIANGYIVTLERERRVVVYECSRSRSGGRQWAGISFLDLAQSFRLDRRAANKPTQRAKQQPTVTDQLNQRPGESDKDHVKRVAAFINGDDVRSKGDLRDWKSCDFTLAPEGNEK